MNNLWDDRKALRIITYLLMGHYELNKHLNNLGLIGKAIFSFCQEEQKTAD